jgi:hypothetical protein
MDNASQETQTKGFDLHEEIERSSSEGLNEENNFECLYIFSDIFFLSIVYTKENLIFFIFLYFRAFQCQL